ncbi:dihydrofolate reductase [Leptospira semungkisensis]|uniref:Dihydrofolate reductase n=1 Tax=Leptospira semungkisensis TaxID=2484985 RepID=A0A4R9FQH4_9LEPT|nr:dihydrofolate reductase family protein [Leptospira semungkisensis]TGK00753.1 dihydrofolate reductase [Leptospira semungkisensis]
MSARKLIVFMMQSLDGYHAGPNGELDWHNVDADFNEFAINQIDSIDTIAFGRKTYELMASYWPTELALQDDPTVAEKMNSMPKIVFSKSMQKADWNNTRLIKDNIPEEISKLKSSPGKDLIIFGSSDLVASLLKDNLIDEVRSIIAPVLLGKGLILFNGAGTRKLQLLETKIFKSGNVLLYYRPLPA